MTEIIREAKTAESAIEAALEELGCTREEADIEIIQEPGKGIFGRTKMAKVKVTCAHGQGVTGVGEAETTMASDQEPGAGEATEDWQENISQGKNTLMQMLMLMGLPNAKIQSRQEEDAIYLDIHSDAEGLLIGRHGQTLASLQYLLNRIMNHQYAKKSRYIVDVGGYRVRYKIVLEKMAKRIAHKVSESKEEEQLEAMSAFDRRIIHMSMKDNPDVTTYSLGEGNFRRVVIAPKGMSRKSEDKAVEAPEEEIGSEEKGT